MLSMSSMLSMVTGCIPLGEFIIGKVDFTWCSYFITGSLDFPQAVRLLFLMCFLRNLDHTQVSVLLGETYAATVFFLFCFFIFLYFALPYN